MECDCYTCISKSDEKKVILVEKVTLASNDPRIKDYLEEYKNILKFAKENGYEVRYVSPKKNNPSENSIGRSR